MTNATSCTLAFLASLGLLGACSEEPATEASTTPTVTVTVTVEGPAGPEGPPGPPGPSGAPGRDGVPAPQMPEPAPMPTDGENGGSGGTGGAGGGGAGGASTGGTGPGSDVTVLFDYDTDVPGVEAEGNAMFLDADMMPLMVVPAASSEGGRTFAEFTIPFDGSAPQQWGWNAELPEAPRDFTGMELVIGLRWVTGFNPDDTWGGLQIYVWSDEWTADISNGWTQLNPATKGTWVEYTLDLATADAADAAPMFNPAAVNAIGFTFNTGGDEITIPAATEAVFQVDYVGVRPVEVAGEGGAGGEGGASGGADAGVPGGSGGAAAGMGGAAAGAGGADAGTAGGGAAVDAGAN